MLIINGLNPNQSSIDIETQFLKSGKNRVEPNLFWTKWSASLKSITTLYTPKMVSVGSEQNSGFQMPVSQELK